MESFLTHVFRKWLLRAILCHHLPNSSFLATFRYTYISELRNASANPILQAAKVTPEPTWEKKFLTHMFQKWLLCAFYVTTSQNGHFLALF